MSTLQDTQATSATTTVANPVDVVAERRLRRQERRRSRAGQDRRHQRTVVVTGGAGYIGSLVVRRLLERGYRVRVLEGLLYGDAPIRDVLAHPNLELRIADLRRHDLVAAALDGADAVLHLGAIVGDAACALDEGFTLSVNLEATRLIAGLCRSIGVPRLVFASTCSVYGASEEVLSEDSALNPVSLYARSKIAAERELLESTDSRCTPVVLRFATAYGASHRPRFDLAVNILTARAVTEGRCTIFGGEQWRPFVHVDDIARALIAALEAPLAKVGGQVFNVGSGEQNHRLAEVGDLIKELLPPTIVLTDDRVLDRRNYYVRFDKIHDGLSFTPTHSLRAGIQELADALSSGALRGWNDQAYDNHRFLQQLLRERPELTARQQLLRERPELAAQPLVPA